MLYGNDLIFTTDFYTVSFNLNDGIGKAPASIKVKRNSAVAIAAPSTTGFTKQGYINDGKWYTDVEGENEFLFGTTEVTRDITLRLKWIQAPSSSSAGSSSSSGEVPSSSSEEAPSSSGTAPSSSSKGGELPSSSSELVPSSSSGTETPIHLPQIASSNQAMQIYNGINLQATRNATVEIYGLDGKLIGKQNFGSGVYNVSLGYLPKGLYIVNVSFGSEKKVLKVPVR